MKTAVVVVGIGEMGSVFARGFLHSGHPLYAVVRGMNMVETTRQLAEPELVVIAVAENDIQTVLQEVPECWRERSGWRMSRIWIHPG